MTDEDRARDAVTFICMTTKFADQVMIMKNALREARADEREKCAKVVETSPLFAKVSGGKARQRDAKLVQGAIVRDRADRATAIRARKG